MGRVRDRVHRAARLYAPPEKLNLGVVQWGFEQGWLRTTPDARNAQNAYLSFANLQGFYDYCAAQLARSA